jgi:hypothetical protein
MMHNRNEVVDAAASGQNLPDVFSTRYPIHKKASDMAA